MRLYLVKWCFNWHDQWCNPHVRPQHHHGQGSFLWCSHTKKLTSPITFRLYQSISPWWLPKWSRWRMYYKVQNQVNSEPKNNPSPPPPTYVLVNSSSSSSYMFCFFSKVMIRIHLCACTCMYVCIWIQLILGSLVGVAVYVEGFRKLRDPGKGNLEKKNFCAGSIPSGAYLRKWNPRFVSTNVAALPLLNENTGKILRTSACSELWPKNHWDSGFAVFLSFPSEKTRLSRSKRNILSSNRQVLVLVLDTVPTSNTTSKLIFYRILVIDNIRNWCLESGKFPTEDDWLH